MVKKVLKNENFYIKKNHRGFGNVKIFGADTETDLEGKPILIQLYDGKNLLIQDVKEENILDIFLDYMEKYCSKKFRNICYFHNFTDFDLSVLFRKFIKEIYKSGTITKLKYKGWDIVIYYCKNNAFVNLVKDKIYLKILDSQRFTMASLRESLKLFNVDAEKLTYDFRTGDRKSDDFIKYSMEDVIAEYKLGEKIKEFHKLFDVSMSVSIAQFSMKVFRHHYLKEKDLIMYPPAECVELSERSYHGGLNIYTGYVPRFYENARMIDINSSYPYSTTFLPSMIRGNFVKVDKFIDGLKGVYLVDGYIESDYPIIFTDDFKPVQGSFENIALTNYEIETTLKYARDYDFKIKYGYVFEDLSDRNPFKDFIFDIYNKRLKAKKEGNKALEILYKYIMNSFYGKFIQADEVVNMVVDDFEELDEQERKEFKDEIKKIEKAYGIKIHYYYDKALNNFVLVKRVFKAGMYYNPFIATLITAKSRSLLLDLLYKFKGFHGATDSVMTTESISGESNELGGYKMEVEGNVYVFRNKFYLFYAKDFSRCKHKPDDKNLLYDDNGYHLCKYATHGFKGDIEWVHNHRYDLLKGEVLEYKYTKVNKLRESVRSGLKVNKFEERKEVLDLLKIEQMEKVNKEVEDWNRFSILKYILRHGKINKDNYIKHWAGELPTEDLKGYITKDGKLTISQIAERLYEDGIIPEYDERYVFDMIIDELKVGK
jgi:hypothetical protein